MSCRGWKVREAWMSMKNCRQKALQREDRPLASHHYSTRKGKMTFPP